MMQAALCIVYPFTIAPARPLALAVGHTIASGSIFRSTTTLSAGNTGNAGNSDFRWQCMHYGDAAWPEKTSRAAAMTGRVARSARQTRTRSRLSGGASRRRSMRPAAAASRAATSETIDQPSPARAKAVWASALPMLATRMRLRSAASSQASTARRIEPPRS